MLRNGDLLPSQDHAFLRVLGLKKSSKFDLFQKFIKTKIFIFIYFSKIPSEMNSNDPFYPILIPNTPYVKFSLFFFLVVGGSQGVPNI